MSRLSTYVNEIVSFIVMALLLVALVSGQLNHPSLRGREVPEGLTLLVKPFETGDLRATVRDLLDRNAPP